MGDILDLPSGKTSPARSPRTRAKTSARSSRNSSGAKFLYLDLDAGPKPEWSEGGGGDPSLGELSTLNFSERPNDVVESSLSSILEATAPQKYYLSAKACRGILRRAKKRGKTLPVALQKALESVANGDVVRTVGHPIVCDDRQVSGTLMASGAGVSRPAGMANETDYLVPVGKVVPIKNVSHANREPGVHGCGGFGVGDEGEPSYALDTKGQGGVAYAIDHTRPFAPGGDVSGTLCGGAHPGGFNGQDAYTNQLILHPVAYAVDCRNLVELTELSGTLQAKSNGGQSLNYINPVRIEYAVRRLMPVECERLQGFPDGWTEGLSDTNRYKGCGNAVNVSKARFIMRRIADRMRREVETGAQAA